MHVKVECMTERDIWYRMMPTMMVYAMQMRWQDVNLLLHAITMLLPPTVELLVLNHLAVIHALVNWMVREPP